MKYFVTLFAISFMVFFIILDNRKSKNEPKTWIHEIVVTGTNNGCPCMYEVWTTPSQGGIIEPDYAYILYIQDDCEHKKE